MFDSLALDPLAGDNPHDKTTLIIGDPSKGLQLPLGRYNGRFYVPLHWFEPVGWTVYYDESGIAIFRYGHTNGCFIVSIDHTMAIAYWGRTLDDFDRWFGAIGHALNDLSRDQRVSTIFYDYPTLRPRSPMAEQNPDRRDTVPMIVPLRLFAAAVPTNPADIAPGFGSFQSIPGNPFVNGGVNYIISSHCSAAERAQIHSYEGTNSVVRIFPVGPPPHVSAELLRAGSVLTCTADEDIRIHLGVRSEKP